MKKMIVILLFCVCSTLFVGTANALNCPYDKLSKLKIIANNVQYDYNYTKKADNVIFSIRFSNVVPDIIIYSVWNKKEYYYNNNSELIIDGLKEDTVYEFIIKPTDGLSGKDVYYIKEIVNGQTVIKEYTSNLPYECKDTDLLKISIKTPRYNKYYNSNICKKYRNNKNCYKWYKHDMEYKKIEERIITEEKANAKKAENGNAIEKISILDMIKKELPIIIGSGILCLILIAYLIKHKDANKFEGW